MVVCRAIADETAAELAAAFAGATADERRRNVALLRAIARQMFLAAVLADQGGAIDAAAKSFAAVADQLEALPGGTDPEGGR